VTEFSPVREPVIGLGELSAHCLHEVFYQLLRYNSDPGRLVVFTFDRDAVYLTAANDQDFAFERDEAQAAFARIVAEACR
jgi:hypothetical protein